MNDLYHPPFVTAALDRVDAMTSLRDLQDALAIVDRHDPGHIPDAVLVRLLRRYSVDPNPDPAMEDVVFKSLVTRTVAWTKWRYSGVDPADREDIAHNVAVAVVEAVRCTAEIDFWEITFDINKKRAAADAYQNYFKRYEREEEVDADILAEVGKDGGIAAEQMTDRAYALAMGRRVLSDDEFQVFEILVRLGLPIASAKSSDDIVRRTGKAQGTVREIVTRIKRKMAAAVEEQTR